MTLKDRRHARYALPDGGLRSQEVKRHGFLGAVTGWGECWVKDISYAGLLLLTQKKLTIGDKISVRLTPKEGPALTFLCAVVNASLDLASGKLKVGVSIGEPEPGSPEIAFLKGLDESCKLLP